MAKFDVHPVEPTASRLKVVDSSSLKAAWAKEVHRGELVSMSAVDPLPLICGPAASLMMTARIAFNSHYPLKLNPVTVWLTIAQSFAKYVDTYAEELRDRYVTHEGKEVLTVVVPFRRGSPFNDYSPIFEQFQKKIGQRVVPGAVDLLSISDFSAPTATDAQVAAILTIHATQQFFACCLQSMCGIPSVELLGTVEDWRKVRAKAEMMRTFDVKAGVIANWLKELLPVLDQFIAACEGHVDREFWGSITNLGGGSGGMFPTGQFISGWVRAFAPRTAEGWGCAYEYVKKVGIAEVLEKARTGCRELSEIGTLGGDNWPNGVTKVPVKMQWVDEGLEEDLQFLTSFLGYQHPDGALEARSAWAIVRTKPSE
jgi:hypothetical protein